MLNGPIFDIGNAPRKRLAGLPQKIHRGGPQNQETRGLFSVPASTVDQPAQCGEQLRHAVYFVEYDQAVLVAAEESVRIGKFGPIFAGFKVEVHGRRCSGDGVGQCRLSDLTGASQGNCGLPGQSVLNSGLRAAGNHPCILSMAWMIYKDHMMGGRRRRWNLSGTRNSQKPAILSPT
jgi:hypothetical protein